MSTCRHDREFQVLGVVACLTATEGGPVTHWTVDVKVRCRSCGMPFRFLGLPIGVSAVRPTASFGEDELRAPIEPAPDVPRWDQPLTVGRA